MKFSGNFLQPFENRNGLPLNPVKRIHHIMKTGSLQYGNSRGKNEFYFLRFGVALFRPGHE
jgi:hypothetical protein